MTRAYLNEVEAVKAWVLRACGWKIRDMQKRFDVDPRRLYEVWEEQDYKGSRFKAMSVYARMFPGHPVTGKFEKHKPRYQRTTKPESQPSLWDF